MNQQAYILGYLSKEADIKLKQIRAGEAYRGKPEVLLKRLREMEKRTGIKLNKMTILANKREFFRNLMRMYFPKTVRQVPSRVVRWGDLMVGLALAGIAFDPRWLIFKAFGELPSAAAGEDFFYSPSTGTVNLAGSANPAIMAHEVGHWLDYERGKAPIKRGWFFYKDKGSKHLPPTIRRELNASLFARRALTPADWSKHKRRLTAALATYLQGEIEERGYKEKHAVPKWRSLVGKGVTPKERKQNFRTVMSSIKHQIPDDMVIDVNENTGRIEVSGKRGKALQQLASELLDTHHKRLSKEQGLEL